jgi:hypothetical protein
MQRIVVSLALIIMAGCGGKPPAPTAAPAAQPASDDKPSVELKLDTQDGAIEFKKDDGGGDSVDVEIKTE